MKHATALNRVDSRKNGGRATWFTAIIALCVYAAVLLSTQSANRPSSDSVFPPGSSNSGAGLGSLAIARLWSGLRLAFHVWESPPNLLPHDTRAVFVSIEPTPTQYPSAMANAVLAWVRSGHTMVLSASGPEPIFRALELDTKYRKFTLTQIRELAHGRQTATWRNLDLPLSTYLSGPGLKDATREYVSQSGAILGAQISVGRGRVIVWTVPAAFENRYIDQAQNFQVVWAFLAGHAIYWDEYGHGAYTGGFLRQMFHGGRTYSLAFLTIAALLYAYASSVRFGRPRLHSTDAPRQGTEFLDALAVHLQNPRLRLFLVELLSGVVWRRVARRMGIPGWPSRSRETRVLPWNWLNNTVSNGADTNLKNSYNAWRQAMADSEAKTKPELGIVLKAATQLLEEVGDKDTQKYDNLAKNVGNDDLEKSGDKAPSGDSRSTR